MVTARCVSHQPMIRVADLHFAYPDGQAALKGIELNVASGEKVALVGPNGAGKSTLMLHLNGILSGQGRIEINGLPITKPNLREIRRQVGLVFQNPDDQLFSPTVFEDVAFGPLHLGLPEAEVRERVARALEQIGMEGFGDRLSHHLSVGEKKGITIATVLAMDPEVLVLDEPSAGLDPRSRRSLINLMRELPQTLLVSTHDLALVRDLLPRMAIMDDGCIVAGGPTEQLLRDAELLEAHGLEPTQ
jgi:cobalt/nickel transport system ATP-binding protein